MGVTKWDTRSLDYSSHEAKLELGTIGGVSAAGFHVVPVPTCMKVQFSPIFHGFPHNENI